MARKRTAKITDNTIGVERDEPHSADAGPKNLSDVNFDEGTADLFSPPTNYYDWSRFVERKTAARPERFSLERYEKLGPDERYQYDGVRKRYHMAFGPLQTKVFNNVVKNLLELATDNLYVNFSPKQGGIINGYGGLGKSVSLTQLGRIYHQQRMREFKSRPTNAGDTYIPVVYVSVPAGTTTKNLMTALVDFYDVAMPIASRNELGRGGGMPVANGRRAATELVLKKWFVNHVRSCNTSLILLDDIHNLHRGNKTAETVNDLIKELMSVTSATFIYAGIDCEKTVLLMDGRTGISGRFTQTQYRFVTYDVTPFPYDASDPNSQWLEYLRTLEKHVCLLRQRPGDLEKLHLYLYLRSQGRIGAVTRLVQTAANRAIRKKVERIDRTLLEEIKTGYANENEYERLRRAIKNVSKDQIEKFLSTPVGKS
jgi:hypothetical protein